MPFTPHVRLKRVAEIGESRAMTNASHRESLLIKTARSMPDRIGWERIINGGRTAATTFSGSAQKKNLRNRMDKDENSGMLKTQTHAYAHMHRHETTLPSQVILEGVSCGACERDNYCVDGPIRMHEFYPLTNTHVPALWMPVGNVCFLWLNIFENPA